MSESGKRRVEPETGLASGTGTSEQEETLWGVLGAAGEELMNRLRRMFDETEAWLSKRRDKRTKAAAHTRRSLNTPTQTER